MRILASILAVLLLPVAGYAAEGGGIAPEIGMELPVTPFLASHPAPQLRLMLATATQPLLRLSAAVIPAAPVAAPQTFSYTPVASGSMSWMASLNQRFGSASPFVINNGTDVINHPMVGNLNDLPAYAGGMLRRFPEIPEASFQQMAAFAHRMRSEMSVSAGLRALDRAHGMVAAIGFASSRFGSLSVERGETQGMNGMMSMRPVTVVRFELPRL